MRRALKYKGAAGHLAAAVTAIVTFIVYLPALSNGFVTWDDNAYVYENPGIRSLDTGFLKWIFGFHVSNWHPLTWVSHAIDYAVWGLDPFGHHLTSVILHSVNTYLVVVLAMRLLEAAKPAITPLPSPLVRGENRGEGALAGVEDRSALIAAAVTGLLFGLHPLHVESVAWVSERKDVLYAFFYLLSILSYLRYAMRRGEAGERLWLLNRNYFFAFLFFALSLMSKPMAITLPAVLLIIDWYPMDRFQEGVWRVIAEKVPFFMLSLGSAVLTFSAQSSGGAVATFGALPLWTRAMVALKALAGYIGKMVLPVGLSPYYPYPDIKEVSITNYGYFIPLAAVVIMTVFSFVVIRRHKVWAAVWFYYVVSLAPVLGVIQVGDQAMADRYTYLPGLGPFLLFGLGMGKLYESWPARRRAAGLAAYAVFVLALVYATAGQIKIWKNGESLWDRVIALYPEETRAYCNRGDYHLEAGEYNKAIADFDRGIRTGISASPMLKAALYSGRAEARMGLGNPGSAVNDMTTALLLSPGYWKIYVLRGRAYSLSGDHDMAGRDFTTAIGLRPGIPDLYYMRGGTFLALGRCEEAVRDFTSAIILHGKPPFNYFNDRGICLARLGRGAEAIRDYTDAISRNPVFPDSYFNRANAYYRLGRFEEALRDYDHAIALSKLPDRDYLRNRKMTLDKLRRPENYDGMADCQRPR